MALSARRSIGKVLFSGAVFVISADISTMHARKKHHLRSSPPESGENEIFVFESDLAKNATMDFFRRAEFRVRYISEPFLREGLFYVR